MHQSKRSDIYLTEFAKICETFAEVSVSWEDFTEVKGNYDFLHLHWPEYYFAGVKPSHDELKNYDRLLGDWKKKAIVIITRHNYLPHFNPDETHVNLYKIFYSNAHVIHHLGNFSRTEFDERYKGEAFQKYLQHSIIPHHYFFSYPVGVTRDQARTFLGIPNDKQVMLVFGSIRKNEEKKLIATAFKSIQSKKKLLLVPRWNLSHQKRIRKIQEGFIFFGKDYIAELWQKKLMLKSDFVDNQHIQIYFKAADFVFISRADTLNSGLPYLYSLFPTPMIGPDIGNISESMTMINGLTYDPKDRSSISQVVNEILTVEKKNGFVMTNENTILGLKAMYWSHVSK